VRTYRVLFNGETTLKIAVLGGAGYLGTHVTKFFNAESLSRRTGFDMTDLEQCRQLRDYDVIIHMAARIDKSEKQPYEVFKTNVQGTLNVVQALRKEQVFIFTSTKDVYTETDAYAQSKILAEKYVEYYTKYSGFRMGIFRLSTTYASCGSGFVNLFVRSIREGKVLFLLMEGKQRRDFLYVDDFSRAVERFLSSADSETYDIGGGEENSTTILGLVKIIEKVTNKKAKIKFSDQGVRGQIHYVTDLSRIMKELNWHPEISLEEGIRKIVRG